MKRYQKRSWRHLGPHGGGGGGGGVQPAEEEPAGRKKKRQTLMRGIPRSPRDAATSCCLAGGLAALPEEIYYESVQIM